MKGVYEATIYRDDELEAAVADRDLGYFPTLEAAVDAVNAAKDPKRGWFTGGVRLGTLHPAVLGKSPEHFEADEREPSWFVGTDGKADR